MVTGPVLSVLIQADGDTPRRLLRTVPRRVTRWLPGVQRTTSPIEVQVADLGTTVRHTPDVCVAWIRSAQDPRPIAATVVVAIGPASMGRPAWIRAGRDEWVPRPFRAGDVAAAIERALDRVVAVDATALDDAALLRVVEACIEDGVPALVPHIMPSRSDGVAWPMVERVLGRGIDGAALGDHLVVRGLASRRLTERWRLCRACGSDHLHLRETCPQCGAMDWSVDDVLHHFPCGFMGDAGQYADGGRLVCPKCHVELRQIGLDYERPTQACRCATCAARFPAARAMVACAMCHEVQDPADTRERHIHRYQLTPAAHEALATRRLGGQDLADLIRDPRTGVFAREYLAHEVHREAQRGRTHGTPIAFILARCVSLTQARELAPGRVPDYAAALVAAVVAHLRPLDVVAQVGRDELGILLPETTSFEAENIAQAMMRTTAAVPPVPGIAHNDLGFSVVAVNNTDADLDHVLAAARAALDTHDLP